MSNVTIEKKGLLNRSHISSNDHIYTCHMTCQVLNNYSSKLHRKERGGRVDTLLPFQVCNENQILTCHATPRHVSMDILTNCVVDVTTP